MSFSSNVKQELSKLNTLAKKDLVKAELLGYLVSNNIYIIKDKTSYSTENEYNINRLNKLLKSLDIEYSIEIQGKVYIITFKTVNVTNIVSNTEMENIKKDEQLQRAFIRGTFMGAGSLNNPEKEYHLSILISNEEHVKLLKEFINKYNIEFKILNNNKNFCLYIKDGEQISRFLALIGANSAMLKFEEIRVMRETRNKVNRLVNCETANLNKTINAAVMQIEDIKYIKEKGKFNKLPENLKEIANLRLENPDASLTELGEKLDEKISKSGVNHRLRKISEIAQEIRKEEKS